MQKLNEKEAGAMYEHGEIISPADSAQWLCLARISSGESSARKSVAVVARVVGRGEKGCAARRVEIVEIPVYEGSMRSRMLSSQVVGLGEGRENIINVVDPSGLGMAVCHDLEYASAMVYRAFRGGACFSSENRSRYRTLRAQAAHQAMRAAKEGRLSIRTESYKQDLMEQACAFNFEMDEYARWKVPQKEGQEAADLWETVCMAFLEGVGVA